VVLFPPAIYLMSVQEHTSNGTIIKVGAQDSYSANQGAFTGQISPAMLKDAGIPFVLLGHSERRAMFGDTDKFVAEKTKAALAEGLQVVLCVGETLEERKADETMKVNERQLEAVAAMIEEKDWGNIVLAYEPVWAIGTGLTASPQRTRSPC